jgi:exodeoxyribonuclease VII small subunit
MSNREKKTVSQDAESIESTLARLEVILQRMESEEQPLEASLADFEEGIRLTRAAQKTLQEAEQKVQLLMENADGEPVSAPFAQDDDSRDT